MIKPWRALRAALIDRVIDWINEPYDDEADQTGDAGGERVPPRCRACGQVRPEDPMRWERWELEHEHLERVW